MMTIFNVFNNGTDGTDGSFICAVADGDLAKRVAQKQGSMGVGPGTIQEVQVFENFDELPYKIKQEIIRNEANEEVRKDKLIEKLEKTFTKEEISQIKEIL